MLLKFLYSERNKFTCLQQTDTVVVDLLSIEKVPKNRTQYKTLVVLSDVSGGPDAKVGGCQPKAHNIRTPNGTKKERGSITGPSLTPNHN